MRGSKAWRALVAASLVVSGLSVAMPTSASAAPVAASGLTADQTQLCQLEGGGAFAVDTGQGLQNPDLVIHPMLRVAEQTDITVIPCWESDATSTSYITSVSANLGDDKVLVGQESALHTTDPFTLHLNGAGTIPPAPAFVPLTIHAIDNHGVERWTGTVSLDLITPCADDDVVDVDTGAVHDAFYPQIEGDAAQITIIPCPKAMSAQPDTWITSVTAKVWGQSQDNDDHPAGEADNLQATSPFTLDLHNYDGTAFVPGELDLYLQVTDNHGNVSWFQRQIWIVEPISASWSAGTTLPDTPTPVRAAFTNTSGFPITGVTFALVTSTLGDAQPVDVADDLSATETMTFTAGSNRVWAVVTLANGIRYPLPAFEVVSRYVVDTTVAAPSDADWGKPTTFHAKAVSSAGVAQRGLRLHLQSRAPGSTTWVDRATAFTDRHGRAALSLKATKTGTASWRVTSSETKKRRSSVSAPHLLRVHAVFGRLPGARTARAGHAISYAVGITPATARARVDVQLHRVGHSGWTTLGHAMSGSGTTTISIRPSHPGRYTVRFVVESSKTLARTLSRAWTLNVTR